MSTALLVLEDGTVFTGSPLGYTGYSLGELVFNTAMTGYQEVLTDPSYAAQIITFTYPHIGNVGCTAADNESDTVHAAGVILREPPGPPSNWRAECDLASFFQQHKVVGISGIDTRHLTHHLREQGSLQACISHQHDAESALKLVTQAPRIGTQDLVAGVTCQVPYHWPTQASDAAELTVVVIDYGVKRSILHQLSRRGCDVWVVPAHSSVAEIMHYKPTGVVLSNGPGDPLACDYVLPTIQQLLKDNIPLLGICLGCQLLALALGAKTMKMKFGHHGSNHPVIDCQTQGVMISSQNHNYTLDERNLPATINITHRSLFDDSVQGFSGVDKPVMAFQGHPEAGPGPHDVESIFDKFITLMKTERSNNA
jgi:carbamoyl-phosphate synthase small subunit